MGLIITGPSSQGYLAIFPMNLNFRRKYIEIFSEFQAIKRIPLEKTGDDVHHVNFGVGIMTWVCLLFLVIFV